MSDHRNSSRANLPKMSATHKILFGCVLTAALLAFSFTSFHRVKDSTQDTTTAGVDADKNGIRDEIDALIEQNYTESPAQKLAAQKFAQLLQLTAIKVYTDQAQALKVTTDQGTALACLRYKTSKDSRERAVKRLMSATYNTLERIRNDEQNDYVSGSQIIETTSEEECK
jgi:hypothetical protein